MENLILTVIAAEYAGGYTLRLKFSNGEEKEYDFSKEYDRGICCKLRDPEYFRNFTLDPFTVDWNNEIAFAPEYLFQNGQNVSKVLPD